jgi:H+/Cl- antiporter ClcA
MTSHTRYRLTLAAAVFLAVVTLLSIFLKMEAVATAGIAGIMTVLSTYIWSQTTRPTTYYHEKHHQPTKPVKNTRNGSSYPSPMDILEKQ